MAYIDIIEYEQSQGELREAYDELISSRGKLASIHKIHSLNPKAMMDHMDLYMTLLYGKSPLKRLHREMIGTAVSIANDCEYCQLHHVEAMNHYWKDDERAARFLKDYRTADLTELEEALCKYAFDHTKSPAVDKKDQLERLKELGLDDRAILDATMIIAYFNFVNRIVLGLDVATEESGVGGYKFD